MPYAPARRLAPPLLFAVIALGIYSVALLLASRLSALDGARVVAIGMTLDMVVVVPLAYYLLVVRRAGAPPVTIVPVVLLAVLAASRVLPASHHAPLRVVEALVVPLELGAVTWIVLRAVRAARRVGQGAGDPLARLHHAGLEVTKSRRAAGLFASEIGALYYALGAWRARADVPAGASAFTHHRESGHGGIVAAFLFLLAVEGLVVHVLLAAWSVPVAWIVTIATIYGALWLLGDYRATVLRPVLVDAEGVTLRAGLRCSLRVRRDQIASIIHEAPESREGRVSLTLAGAPTLWIVLGETLVAEGPYGTRRRVRAVGLHPDARAALVRALGGERGSAERTKEGT